MKKYYWRNLLLSQLSPQTAVEVFSTSIGKLEDVSFLNSVLSVVRSADLEDFLTLLRRTTYVLEETEAAQLLAKHPLSRQAYVLLKELIRFRVDDSVRQRVQSQREDFLLNYCLIREVEQDYSTFELFEAVGLAESPHRGDSERDFAQTRYFHILKEMIHNLKVGKIKRFSTGLADGSKTGAEGAISVLRRRLKDPLLLAILDPNGRVNALEYSMDDILLVSPHQVYNLSDKSRILLVLRGTGYAGQPEVGKLLEDAMLQTDIKTIHTVLFHAPQLRLPKYLKVLLKIYISECMGPSSGAILKTVGLFDMTGENETVAISFLKASETYLNGAVKVIPHLMKGVKLYFASFITLLKAFAQGNPFVRLAVKNIVHRFNQEFHSALGLILEFYNKVYLCKAGGSPGLIHNETSGTGDNQGKVALGSSLTDMDFLLRQLSTIADMFALPASQFISRNIYHIFNAFYPCSSFTPAFVESHLKYVVVQRILDSSYRSQVEDVDVLVGLLFQDHFASLDQLFKPSVSLFIRKNLSHVLFKVKSTYVQGIYPMKACIYKVMKYVLEQVNLNLYFSYVWPYVEFLLNSQPCVCAGYFLEWLRSFHNSRLMYPYLTVPFDKIEDLPVIPNLEVKIAEMLARFFSVERMPFEYHACPYGSNTGGNGRTMGDTVNPPRAAHGPIDSLYSTIRNCIPAYTPHKLPITDRGFVENFLKFYHSNKSFRNTINALNPGSLPLSTKALFGDLRYPSAPNWHSSPFLYEVSAIPRVILLSFLLKINYEQQDLFAFTIQECLKCIKEPFEPEVESFIDQFRHTKFEYKFTLRPVATLDFSSYRSFLESAFTLLYAQTRRFHFMKYLILFDDSTLEFACLCLIKALLAEGCTDWSLFNGVQTALPTWNPAILRFLLKINTFVCATVIERAAYLTYALRAGDYYSLIYCLEDGEGSGYDVLQVAYYMVGDLVRVKGFNIGGVTEYSRLNLFFDFIIGRNYKAAEHVYATGRAGDSAEDGQTSGMDHTAPGGSPTARQDISKDTKSAPEQTSSIAATEAVKKASAEFIEKAVREILDCNESVEVEEILVKDIDIGVHILKDLELLISSMASGGASPPDAMPHSGMQAVIDLIRNRRGISKNPELILKIHKHLEAKIGNRPFSRSVDLELIKSLIRRKEHQRAEEEIARLTLQGEHRVLYDHALIKIEQRQYSEAKELLRRMRQVCPRNSIEYFKATVKLCELGQNRGVFELAIRDLESINDHNIEAISGGTERTETTSTDMIGSGERGSGRIDTMGTGGTIGSGGKSTGERGTTNTDSRGTDSIGTTGSGETLKEAIGYTQKLYFLTAKYFEKHDTLISVKYYFKSFTSNYEAIPRFFHLISAISRTHLKIIAEMIETIKKEYLPSLLPFYNQISTKIAVESGSLKFYKDIVFTMLERFPHHTHWNTLFLYNSKKAEVGKILAEIVNSLSLERRRLFMDIRDCSEKFTAIARHSAPTLSMECFPDIRNLFPSQVNIPGQSTEINNIRNEIMVFRSLQKPKKITLVGEDGRDYPMIVKFKDDLRKDSRFMDLDSLLNTLLKEDFYIRKYNVIPFNHEAGIIEFIPDLLNLKEIVFKYHDGIPLALQRFVRTKMVGASNMQGLISQFPPVFNRHLRSAYTDPFQFYRSRESYIRTYAIMNIVGWFMGLGDRHCENIHFDQKTGDTVHVDLNCIFDKAKSLEIPEKVPFRLTQNIIDGFGALGLEGTYKETLKYTIGVLRDNRDVIQANLLSFVFDPLFEWARKKTEPMKIIEGMNGKLDFEDSEFKVEELIGQASDVNNLGEMYIGWMAFI